MRLPIPATILLFHVFQSTHPLRGATAVKPHDRRDEYDFNPRTPCGVRPLLQIVDQLTELFQSTHPLRGATGNTGTSQVDLNISIHAPLAGCDCAVCCLSVAFAISIHAPLAGCDSVYRYVLFRVCFISIHAPLAGCDSTLLDATSVSSAFQSTHPLRGATIVFTTDKPKDKKFQSTHPLRGATCADLFSVRF